MIVGVDTGGTKTLVTVFSDTGMLLAREKFLTPRDIHVYIEQVTASINHLLTERDQLKALSVAVPGTVENQIAVVCKNLGWQNIDILGMLSAHFPEVPMWLENDANLGGLGATRLLEPQPKQCLYITISTGIGAGFTVDGHIDRSIAANEVGDMVLEHDRQLRTWENLASGTAIMSEYGVYASDLKDERALMEVGKRMARGLLVLLPVLRPDSVVLGGGVGAHFASFEPFVHEELSILSPEYRCHVFTAPFPEEVVAYGCYFYAADQLDA